MDLSILIGVAAGLVPVFAFLAALVFLDSYKLVRLRAILLAIVAGVVAAGVSYLANTGLLGRLSVDAVSFRRYVAPVVEEAAKAAYAVYLVRTFRVGFLVDAAIQGFAIGAGFAFVENLYYLRVAQEATVWTWIVRGFGTAVMHGGTTAIFTMVTKAASDRAGRWRIRNLLPGLGLAMALHSLFNHFLLPPVLTTAILIVALPMCMMVVFQQSEKYTRDWLGVGFDTDQELLALITSGRVVDTRVGQYLTALKARFPGEVIVDMLCLLRIHVELSIRAKGILMMRQAGFRVPPDPKVRARFEELRYLEKSLGATGLLAISPFLHTSSRDLWQRNMLSEGLSAGD